MNQWRNMAEHGGEVEPFHKSNGIIKGRDDERLTPEIDFPHGPESTIRGSGRVRMPFLFVHQGLTSAVI